MSDHLPPVLSYNDLRFVSFAIDGVSLRIVFKRWLHPGQGEIVVVIRIPRSEITYEYWSLDSESRTLIQYRGPHGDPERDERVDLHGV